VFKMDDLQIVQTQYLLFYSVFLKQIKDSMIWVWPLRRAFFLWTKFEQSFLPTGFIKLIFVQNVWNFYMHFLFSYVFLMDHVIYTCI